MNTFAIAPLLRLFGGAVLLLCAHLAHAQYAWIDDKGVRHYSDRPPPPSTPAAQILKAPRSHQLASPVQTSAPAAVASGAEQKPKAAPTLAEREVDFRKRATEQAERDAKAADVARNKADLAENCNRVRQAKAQLESGVRIAAAGSDGEPGYMSDDERARQVARANKILADCR